LQRKQLFVLRNPFMIHRQSILARRGALGRPCSDHERCRFRPRASVVSILAMRAVIQRVKSASVEVCARNWHCCSV
jgi:hypothetical protein